MSRLRHIHWGFMLVALILSVLVFGVSLRLYPEWTRSGRLLVSLAAAILVTVVGLIAAARQAFETRSPALPSARSINADNLNAGGDINLHVGDEIISQIGIVPIQQTAATLLEEMKQEAGALSELLTGYEPIRDQEAIESCYRRVALLIGQLREYSEVAQSARDFLNSAGWIIHDKGRTGFETKQQADEMIQELEQHYRSVLAACNSALDGLLATPDASLRIPELRLRLFRMDDRAYGEAITFNQTNDRRFVFGFALENIVESTIAKEIDARVEVHWRGNLIQRAPKLRVHARTQSWRADINQLTYSQPAILTLHGQEHERCSFGQPLEWYNFSLELEERIEGYFLLQYRVSSAQPQADARGELRIFMT